MDDVVKLHSKLWFVHLIMPMAITQRKCINKAYQTRGQRSRFSLRLDLVSKITSDHSEMGWH